MHQLSLGSMSLHTLSVELLQSKWQACGRGEAHLILQALQLLVLADARAAGSGAAGAPGAPTLAPALARTVSLFAAGAALIHLHSQDLLSQNCSRSAQPQALCGRKVLHTCQAASVGISCENSMLRASLSPLSLICSGRAGATARAVPGREPAVLGRWRPPAAAEGALPPRPRVPAPLAARLLVRRGAPAESPCRVGLVG